MIIAALIWSKIARFWVQVIDELRRGVRLKKSEYSRAPIEYQLTPYEILMEDIRSKKYQLRKVMVNGDIPPRVKKDAHALILEFIRSRPPLKKASERQLPPPVIHAPTPREQLMDSIRKGHTLKHVQTPMQSRLKDRLLPPPTSSSSSSSSVAPAAASSASASASASASSSSVVHQSLSVLKMDPSHDEQQRTTPRSKQRLIKVDFSLLQDDDTFFDDCLATTTTSGHAPNIGVCSQPKMPPYPIGGYIVNEPVGKAAPTTAQLPVALSTRLLRRTSI